MKSMREIILQLLQLSGNNYEKMVLNHFHQWCLLHCMDDNDLQKLLVCPALFNWWYNEYEELERKFAKRAIDLVGRADAQVMRSYHAEIIANVQSYYSKPLMKVARNHKPLTPQHN